MKACPAPEQLMRWLAEDLPFGDQSDLEAHLEGCARCQELLETRLREAAPELATCRPRTLVETGGDSGWLSRLARRPGKEAGGRTSRGSTPTLQQTTAERSGPGSRWEPPPELPDYEILEEIGRGGMGRVYRARHKKLNRMVALKMLHAVYQDFPQALARFRTEAEAIARLQHANIVQIYDVGESSSGPYLALELVGGGSLADHLTGTPWPAPDAAGLAETLARAVDFAHQQGVVHRDLKPANVLLVVGGPLAGGGPDRPSLVPKITDFGLARWLGGDHAQTQSGVMAGTPSYMAPEQACSQRRVVEAAADIYSLGAILYELLTGRPPFRAESPVETVLQVLHEEPVSPGRLRPRLSRDLETICLKCLEKEPRRRYLTARALADDLSRFRSGQPVSARPAWPGRRLLKWARRRPAVAVLLVVCGLMASGLLTVILRSNAQLDAALQSARRDEARAQRSTARAEKHFAKAREAVDRLLTQVAELRWRNEPRLEKERHALLEQALAFYEGFLDENGDDPAVRREAAWAHHRLGRILRELWQPQKALASLERAVAILEELVAEGGGAPDYRHDLAINLRDLGGLLVERNEVDAAERALARAVAVTEALVADEPANGELVWRLANLLVNHCGVLRRTGQLKETEPAYRRAINLERKALAERPTDRNHRFELARALSNLGSLLLALGRLREAEDACREALRLREDLFGETPHLPGARHDVGVSLEGSADLLMATGRPGEAAPAYRQAVAHWNKLLTDFPAMPAFRLRAAESFSGLGMCLQLMGQADAAEAPYRQSARLYRELAADFPDRVPARRHAADTANDLAWCLALTPGGEGDPAWAVRLARAALKREPREAVYWNTLALAAYRAGDDGTALAAADRSLQLHGTNADDQFVRSLVLARQGRSTEARAAYARAQRILAENPAPAADRATGCRLGAEAAERLGVAGPVVGPSTTPPAPDRGDAAALLGGPSVSELYRYLDTLYEQGRYRDFVQLAEQAPALTAKNTRLIELSGRAQSRLGHPEEAARLFEHYLRHDPGCVRVLIELARCRLALGALDESRRLLEDAAGRAREASDAYKLAALYASGPPPWRDVRKARSCAANAVALAPTNVFFLGALVVANWQIGETQQSAAATAKALQSHPDDLELYCLHAGVLLMAGDHEAYRRACAHVLRRFGDFRNDRDAYLVARTCLLAPDGTSDLLAVLKLAEQAAAAAGTGWYLHTAGLAHLRADHAGEAVRFFQRSLAEDPGWAGHVLNWLGLALAHQHAGQTESARAWLAKARSWLDQADQGLSNDDFSALGLHPHDWCACRLLLAECESLVEGRRVRSGQP
jgi:tetratricopeptide (TPR) repeat protein/tRNA A-37 threonylcarbamoyl transferase component Bud32